MKISAAAWDVFADILTTFAGILLFAIPGYALAQDWFRLTSVIILCILMMRIAIQFRQTNMTSLNAFFNSVQVLAALLIIAISLYYPAFVQKPHKR